LDTAAEIATVLAVAVEVDPRLVELDYGEWDGRRLDEVSRDDWTRWRNDPAFAPPGGESLVDVGARVGAFCDERLRPDTTIVAVSHVSPIKAAVSWVLGAGADMAWRSHLDQASINRVGVSPRGATLRSFNETWHLAAVR